jgi:NCAIR mutase (PurE)-related protein
MTFQFDYPRKKRTGIPEAVMCEGKSDTALLHLVEELSGNKDHPVLFTRLSQRQFKLLEPAYSAQLDYDAESGTAFRNGKHPSCPGLVSLVGAGTSDLHVVLEAQRTLEFLGIASNSFVDVGVAGLHRFMDRLDEISSADVVIIIAGNDAALASVASSLVSKPVIGVPTSVGYGVATGGQTALNAMLASCAQGLTVTNIDNGFGAACAAARIINSSYQLLSQDE